MALYEYECRKCSDRFEIRRTFNDKSAVVCPKCQGEGRRIFSPAAAIFNGSGFYSTDSRKSESTSGSCGDTSRSYG
ncbi:FmdB family zinc ribbon protein [Chloroflexota bacterium]